MVIFSEYWYLSLNYNKSLTDYKIDNFTLIIRLLKFVIQYAATRNSSYHSDKVENSYLIETTYFKLEKMFSSFLKINHIFNIFYYNLKKNNKDLQLLPNNSNY